MKILVTVNLLILTLVVNGQSLREEILAYEKYCNEEVLDTITQTGLATCGLIPITENGIIIEYRVSLCDTTWSKPLCPEYKDYDNYRDFPLLHDNLSFRLHYDTLMPGFSFRTINNEKTVKVVFEDTGEIYYINLNDHKTFKKPVEQSFVCTVKRRKPVAFSIEFWEWVKNR